MIERVLETIFGRNRTHSNPFLLGIIHISSKLKIRQNLFADGSVAVAFDDIIVESCKECLVLLFAVAPFAIIRRDCRRDLDFAARQSIVLFALLGQRYLDDDLVVRNTVRRGVFRRGGVAVCRDTNFTRIGKLEFNGGKNFTRFCCTVISEITEENVLARIGVCTPFALHCGQKVPSMLADMTSASPGFHPARGLFLTSVVRA